MLLVLYRTLCGEKGRETIVVRVNVHKNKGLLGEKLQCIFLEKIDILQAEKGAFLVFLLFTTSLHQSNLLLEAVH